MRFADKINYLKKHNEKFQMVLRQWNAWKYLMLADKGYTIERAGYPSLIYIKNGRREKQIDSLFYPTLKSLIDVEQQKEMDKLDKRNVR